MGFQTAIAADEAIEAAREISSMMHTAVSANPSAGSAEVSLVTFMKIASLLEVLAHRLEHSALPRDAVAGGASHIDREALIGTLSKVTTMGGGTLTELLAPSEIREIADAVISALPAASFAPPFEINDFHEDALTRLLNQYR